VTLYKLTIEFIIKILIFKKYVLNLLRKSSIQMLWYILLVETNFPA